MPDFNNGLLAAMFVALFALMFAFGGFMLRHWIGRIIDRITDGRPDRPGKP